MWWYRALRRNLVRLLPKPAGDAPRLTVLDAGCGTGGLLRALAEVPGLRTIGVDVSPIAAGIAARAGASVVVGSVTALPFPAESFDVALSADVLCHGGFDDRVALAELHRCLRPKGTLILNLPAYGWMLSDHDRAVDNVRRYTAGDVTRRLIGAGFRPTGSTYWNSIPFPLMVARRKLLGRILGAGSDVGAFPGPLEAVFRGAMAIERALLDWRVRLPFGGSVLATAVKP